MSRQERDKHLLCFLLLLSRTHRELSLLGLFPLFKLKSCSRTSLTAMSACHAVGEITALHPWSHPRTSVITSKLSLPLRQFIIYINLVSLGLCLITDYTITIVTYFCSVLRQVKTSKCQPAPTDIWLSLHIWFGGNQWHSYSFLKNSTTILTTNSIVNFLVRRWKRALVMMVIMFVCTLDWRDNAGVSEKSQLF